MIGEYLAVSIGVFIIVFIELLNTHSLYTLRAIFNPWGCAFIALNILAGIGVYFITTETGILQIATSNPQNLNLFFIAFIIGTSFQVIIRSQLTLLRLRKPNSTEKIDLSTPWDKWYETFTVFFYNKIDKVVLPYIIKDVDKSNLRAIQLRDNCSIPELKNYIEAFIAHCHSPRIKQQVEEIYSQALQASDNQKGDESRLHLLLATIVQEYISEDQFKALTDKVKKST